MASSAFGIRSKVARSYILGEHLPLSFESPGKPAYTSDQSFHYKQDLFLFLKYLFDY